LGCSFVRLQDNQINGRHPKFHTHTHKNKKKGINKQKKKSAEFSFNESETHDDMKLYNQCTSSKFFCFYFYIIFLNDTSEREERDGKKWNVGTSEEEREKERRKKKIFFSKTSTL